LRSDPGVTERDMLAIALPDRAIGQGQSERDRRSNAKD
jgi:hypothetical protein